ncbi:MAG: dicarboxylate/amino acid:cation symporter [Spirochaetales bacterium]|nr:dicarboxylate/amino acid:cation symporter [Spirochaetales bacterium]
MKTLQIRNDINELPGAIDFIRQSLSEKNIPKKEVARTLLVCEDALAKMIDNASGIITINRSSMFGSVEIRISSKGDAFDISDIEQRLIFDGSLYEDDEASAVMHRMIRKLYGDNFSIRCEHGINKATIKVQASPFRQVFITLFALIAGIAVGFILQKWCPAAVAKGLSDNIFTPVYAMFMNSLKMIVAPLVFCSIASSFADFSDIKALGKIAIKIVALYIFTSMIAICIGYAVYIMFPIGSPDLANAVTDEAADLIVKGSASSVSVRDTIVGAIPNNIIDPFRKSAMLQIIFMAVVLGFAAGSVAREMPQLKNALTILNKVFSKITLVIVSIIPVVVFCSMAKMMVSMNVSRLLNVVVWIPVIYLGNAMMMCFYMLLLTVSAGLNPFKFLSKFSPAMSMAFSLGSSNATLPTSLKSANHLGISKKISSFSLPLGATINMDGSCVVLMISVLFMAKIFGIDVTGSMLFSLFMSIIVLSIGAPGVPGGALICMTILFQQVGIPAEAVTLVMGLYPIAAMAQTCTNVTGDGAVTAIVARHEKMLDIEKYNA